MAESGHSGWVSPSGVGTSQGDRRWQRRARKPDRDFRGAVRLVRETGKPIAQVAPPGGSGTAIYNVTNLASTPTTVTWTATPSGGVTVKSAGGSLTVPAGSSANADVTFTAGQTEAAAGMVRTLLCRRGRR